MKASERWQLIVVRYNAAFNGCNGHYPHSHYFENGWAYLQTKDGGSTSKYRVTQIEEMTINLEARFITTLN